MSLDQYWLRQPRRHKPQIDTKEIRYTIYINIYSYITHVKYNISYSYAYRHMHIYVYVHYTCVYMHMYREGQKRPGTRESCVTCTGYSISDIAVLLSFIHYISVRVFLVKQVHISFPSEKNKLKPLQIDSFCGNLASFLWFRFFCIICYPSNCPRFLSH